MRRKVFGSLALLLLASVCGAYGQDESTVPPGESDGAPPTVAEKTEGLERHEGLLTFHVDRRGGKIWLELPPPADAAGEIGRHIWIESLRAGLGSNPVGLDRGQIGANKLVRWRRVGGKVILQEINLRYRALSDDPAERRAVEESFATSILWAGEVEAEDEDGSCLVDFTPFLLLDAHGVARSLKQAGQGTFKLDGDRCIVDLSNCLAFPENIEFESLLTFASDEPGPLVRSTAPTAQSVTLIQHHSFVQLPDDGYEPRRFDPRVSAFAMTFADYAADLDEPLEQRWIARHRLEKTDPSRASSPVKEPIVYYVDRGAPEPIRSALVEGASWWAEAFESAGFEDAFRVEVMPEHAHPLDARYNVIQWVHRSTRGWSYGNSVTDPRTNEIIKGHVSLGSLRVRQDRLIFEGLAGAGQTGTGAADDPIELSLARIRQLAAHEVGHTLGFAHNFAASTYAGRASVMDYPAPLIRVDEDGELDFSDVYGVGIGAWDTHAVRYAYAQFAPDVNEEDALETIVRDGLDRNLLFLSDADARPPGAAHPLTSLWDNGADPVAALEESLRVRQIALDRFGEGNLRAGRPTALLHEVLVPVYLHHRYQLDAAVKVIGGLDYRYAVIGDGQTPVVPVDGAWQRRAIDAVLSCLAPQALELPEHVIDLLPPRPFGHPAHEELFDGRSDPGFDPLAAARIAADLVVGGLLQPQRCERMIIQHRQDATLPSLDEVLQALEDHGFDPMMPLRARDAHLHRIGQQAVVDGLINLARDEHASEMVRAHAERRLALIRQRVDAARMDDPDSTAHFRSLLGDIRRFLEREQDGPWRPSQPASTPPGSPIGFDLGGCSMDH